MTDGTATWLVMAVILEGNCVAATPAGRTQIRREEIFLRAVQERGGRFLRRHAVR